MQDRQTGHGELRVEVTALGARVAALEERIPDRVPSTSHVAPAGAIPVPREATTGGPVIPGPNGKDMFRNVRDNGDRYPTTYWSRDSVEVNRPRPADLGKFVRNGGLPNELQNKYIVPSGSDLRPHAHLLPTGYPIERASTPIEDRPNPVHYPDKVYYHVAASNHEDASALGLRFEKRDGVPPPAWANVPAFARDVGLWCCDDPAADRNKFSHYPQRNPENGDFLKAGVGKSGPDDVLMRYRDRASRRGR